MRSPLASLLDSEVRFCWLVLMLRMARCERAVALREVLIRDHPTLPKYRKELAESFLRFGQARWAERDVVGAHYRIIRPRMIARWRRAVTGSWNSTPATR